MRRADRRKKLATQALQRPPQELLHFDRRPLSRVHVLFLALTGAVIAFRYPHSLGMAILVTATGALAEWAPQAWRRRFFAETSLVITGLITLWWAWWIDGRWPSPGAADLSHSAFHGWVRLLVAAWLLVPSRPGFLRIIAVMIGLEILLAYRVGPPETAAMAQIILAPLGIAALAADAHLRIGSVRPVDAQVGRVRCRAMHRWILPTVMVACGIAAACTVAVFQVKDAIGGGDRSGPSGTTAVGDGSRLSTSCGIDDPRWHDQDPAVVARLVGDEMPAGPWYLRSSTTPRLDVDGGKLTWHADGEIRVTFEDDYQLNDGHETKIAILHREVDYNDMVLRPDGCNQVMLFNMHGDADGNVSRADLGERARYYEVDLGAASYPIETWADADLDSYSYVPARLRNALRSQIPAIEDWRRLDALAAANGITAWLHSRTTYDTANLPAIGNAFADGLMTFLFDEDPMQRRGHCQYYATAMTVLLRCSGHRARCVVGYASQEAHDQGIVFRRLGAHAWTEVLDRGRQEELWWYRVDATPAGHLDMRTQGVDLGEDPFDEDYEENLDKADLERTYDEHEARGRSMLLPWLLTGLAVAAIAALLLNQRRRGNADRRQFHLDRQSDSLIGLAVELGIAVDQHTTLTALVRAIEKETGADLDDHLAAHLRARFDTGPLPPDWPLADLRKAARQPVPT